MEVRISLDGQTYWRAGLTSRARFPWTAGRQDLTGQKDGRTSLDSRMAGLHWTAGRQDFTGQKDGRTSLERRTSLNRTSLDGRSSLDGRTSLDSRTSLDGRTSLDNRTSLDGRPLLEDMVERSLLEYADVQLLMYVRMWSYMCQCGLICMFVCVWRGVAGGTKFLERNVFLYGNICVILFELKCKFLCSETIFCIVIGRQGFLGWQDFPGRQDFAGELDFTGGQGPWRTGLH